MSKKTTEEFIADARKVHGGKYDYSKSIYKTSKEKVVITCKIHGDFKMTPNDHLKGCGCPACKTERLADLKRLTKEVFVERARCVHKDKYDYSLVNYVNSATKIAIICPIHGVFEQRPSSHLAGRGCQICARISESSCADTDSFIRLSKMAHRDKYGYERTVYRSSKGKVVITCPEHGDFMQSPRLHLRGCSCPKCAHKYSMANRSNTEDFVKKSKLVHGNKYEYSKTVYVNKRTKLCITCPAHGDFWQLPESHVLRGEGCPLCYFERERVSQADLISRFKGKHGDRYDYSRVEYKTMFDRVCIICKKHGVFYQSPTHHLAGCGCPTCKMTKGENKIKVFLDEHKIKYQQEYNINNGNLFCENRKFRVDFYLPDINTIIEYDGIQHFESVEYFGGENAFVKRRKRDIALERYCKGNNIRLIKISFKQYGNLSEILKKELEGELA